MAKMWKVILVPGERGGWEQLIDGSLSREEALALAAKRLSIRVAVVQLVEVTTVVKDIPEATLEGEVVGDADGYSGS